MEFKVGSIEELNYIAHLVQKQCDEIDNQIKNDNNILNIKEYKYLQYLVFKYCLIPNADLSAS
jgi:hypothetical protein